VGKIRLGVRKQAPGGESRRLYFRSVPPNIALPVQLLRQAEVPCLEVFSANFAHTVPAARR